MGRAHEDAAERRLPWYGWLAVSILLAGEVGLLLDVLVIRISFYFLAWWSYILLADAWVWKLRGNSLLRSRSWEFLVLAFWSVPIWHLFEAANFRLQNWFYVNVPARFPAGALPSFLAYATVLPGLFETYELLSAFRIAEGAHMRPWRIRPSGLALSVVTGVAMLAAALIFPRAAYPLIWGFALFLLDPLCYRASLTRGGSLLGQFERGDPRPFLRLLLAGLICGGLWEFWNYWAYTKWIYTVPFFEDMKWFEMPPLGFLGFPPFTLECYVLANVLTYFRRGRGWEETAGPGSGAPRRLAVLAIAATLLWNGLIYAGIDRWTIMSYTPTLTDLDGIRADVVRRLGRAGVTMPPLLLTRTATSERLIALSQVTGIPPDDLRAARETARLADLTGLGATNANALQRLGITRVEGLARQDPEALVLRWRTAVPSKPPSLAQVKAWVGAARRAVTPP